MSAHLHTAHMPSFLLLQKIDFKIIFFKFQILFCSQFMFKRINFKFPQKVNKKLLAKFQRIECIIFGCKFFVPNFVKRFFTSIWFKFLFYQSIKTANYYPKSKYFSPLILIITIIPFVLLSTLNSVNSYQRISAKVYI